MQQNRQSAGNGSFKRPSSGVLVIELAQLKRRKDQLLYKQKRLASGSCGVAASGSNLRPGQANVPGIQDKLQMRLDSLLRTQQLLKRLQMAAWNAEHGPKRLDSAHVREDFVKTRQECKAAPLIDYRAHQHGKEMKAATTKGNCGAAEIGELRLRRQGTLAENDPLRAVPSRAVIV